MNKQLVKINAYLLTHPV